MQDTNIFLAEQRILDARREADHLRLVRQGRPLRGLRDRLLRHG